MVARAISFSQFTSSFLCDIADVESKPVFVSTNATKIAPVCKTQSLIALLQITATAYNLTCVKAVFSHFSPQKMTTNRFVVAHFETYQKARQDFAQGLAELAQHPQNIDTIKALGGV